MSKKTKERRLSPLKERFLLALHKGIITTAELKASLEIDTRKFYTEIGNLQKDEYVESLGYATWALDTRGDEYVTTWLGGAIGQPFEDSKVQDFLTLFPEPYQGILRLTLSCCVAKRTKLFEAFGAGFPATLLIGEAGIGKSPTGYALSWLQGKKPSDVTIDARLLTKGEFGGRLEWYGKKGHKKRRLALSYWQKQDWVQIEEFEKIVDKDVTGIIKTIAWAEKFFIREGKPYPNKTVPFLTMNEERRRGQVALDKIITKAGIPFLKRNNCLFCNASKGILDGDSSKFFRRVLGETPEKKVPVLTLNVPILKTELSDVEFDLLARLIKEGMLPGIDNSHVDKRGVGIEVLGFYALTGNKDITSATYRIVKDRLWCLESLGLTRDGWRAWYNKEWLEYEGVANPERAEEIREAIKRQRELEDSIVVVDISKGIHNGKVNLAKRHNTMLDKLRKMRDFLKFPLTGIEEVRLPDYKKKELCSRYKANNEGLRENIEIEIKVLDPVTEDNVRIGIDVAKAFWRNEVQPIEIAFSGDIQRQRTIYLKGLSDVGLKKDVVRGIETLIRDLWQADLWATATNVFVRTAIKNLREKSGVLRSHLQTVLKHKKDSSLDKLQWELKNAEAKSRPWFEDFEEDSKDLGIEITTAVAKGVYDTGARIVNFFKGKGTGKSKGGGKGEKRPPRSPSGFNDRNIDDL